MPRDAVTGLVVLVFAGLYWLAADGIRKSSLEDEVGAAGVPHTLAVLLAGLAILLIVRGLIARPRAAPVPDADAPKSLPRPHLRAAGMVALGIAYVTVLPSLGYVLSVALLLGAAALYNGSRPSPGLAMFAVVGAAGFYVLFVYVLNIPLPPGIWPGLIGA